MTQYDDRLLEARAMERLCKNNTFYLCYIWGKTPFWGTYFLFTDEKNALIGKLLPVTASILISAL